MHVDSEWEGRKVYTNYTVADDEHEDRVPMICEWDTSGALQVTVQQLESQDGGLWGLLQH